MAVADLAELKLTKEQEAEVKRFTGQLVRLGCALMPALSREEVEAEIYAAGKVEWLKVCRGDPELEKAWPKVAAVIDTVLDLLFAANEAVERAVGE